VGVEFLDERLFSNPQHLNFLHGIVLSNEKRFRFLLDNRIMSNEWIGTTFITLARIEKYQEIFNQKGQLYASIEKNISLQSFSPKETRIPYKEAMKGEVSSHLFILKSLKNQLLEILLDQLLLRIGLNLNFKFLWNGKMKFIYCGIQKQKPWYGGMVSLRRVFLV
jgi:hypothetical protein